MTDIIVKVMVDVLLILALVTREIKQGKISGFILDDRPFPFQLIYSSGRFLKKLIGRSDMKDALQRFDQLTQEESRMAVAQGLKAAHGVGNDVRDVGDKVDAVLDGAHHISFGY
jgi:hypothetical protein